jgi:SAM-dependent methyltransferase
MYELSAPYYDRFYDFLDYRAAAESLHALLREHRPGAATLLDVACGSGRYLEYLRAHYRVAGLDILPTLLDLARQRCPGVPLHRGDMTGFELGERYDVVTCLFCSIGYVRTAERMRRAVACMAAHLRPGGLLVLEPWVSPDRCWTERVTCEVHDGPELKIVRMHSHDRQGNLSVYDIHYLVGTPQGVTHFVEREEMGLFTPEEYRAALEDAGLLATYLDRGLFPGHVYGLHLGRMPD